MRQHDLSFANFVLRFGFEEVLLDYAKEIVIPAFMNEDLVRTYGDTTYRFHKVHFTKVANHDEVPVLALSGHFVKDTILRRQQIFSPQRGLVEDAAAMASAPSAFFVLILNYHRILYFAETAAAPTLDAFEATAQHFLREEYRRYLREDLERQNVTRRGVDKLTLKQLQRRIPPPRLAVTPVAGKDIITETIQRFGKIKQIRLKLIEPNDELDASEAVAAVEKTFRPMAPQRLEVVAADPRGLNKEEAAKTIIEVSEGQNTEIIVDGEDKAGLRMKVDNEEFALSVPVGDPPSTDAGLRGRLVQLYDELVAVGKVKRPTPSAGVIEKLSRLLGLL